MITLSKSNKLINSLLTVGAASLLAGAVSVHAAGTAQSSQEARPQAESQANQQQSLQQQNQQQQNQQQSQEAASAENSRQFSSADQNQDEVLVWTEIWAVHEDELAGANMSEESTLGTYDTNRDQALDENEYAVFITDIAAYPAESGSENRQGAERAGDSDRQLSASNEQPSEDHTSRAIGGNQQDQNFNVSQDSGAFAEERDRSEARTSSDLASSDNATSQQQNATSQQQDATIEQPVVFHQAFIAITEPGASPSELQDRTVVNAEGEEIGEVQDVVMSNDGTEAGVVVGVGGVLGIGEKDVFLSADQLRAGPNGEEIVWETSMSEDRAENLPEYNEERFTSLTEDA